MQEIIRLNKEKIMLIQRKYLTNLEEKLGVKIEIDEEVLTVHGESSNVYFAIPVIKAISRGFSLEIAMLLKNTERSLKIINLHDFCSNENCVSRLKARVIGKQGSIKTALELATDSKISVYGHTISFIAPLYSSSKVEEAINMILSGAKHSSVLGHLSKIKEQLFLEKLKGK